MNKKLAFLLEAIGSIVINYIIFYNVTSVFIVRFYQGIQQFLNPLLLMILLFQNVIIYCFIILFKKKYINKMLYHTLIILYGIIMLVLLFARYYIGINTNFDLRLLFVFNIENFFQISMNFLCFLPLGYFLRRCSIIQLILMSVALILGIECLQLITKRGIFDICDIVINLSAIWASFALVKKYNFDMHHFFVK